MEKLYEYVVHVADEKQGVYSPKDIIGMMQRYSKNKLDQEISRGYAQKVIDDLVEQKEIYFKPRSIFGFKSILGFKLSDKCFSK